MYVSYILVAAIVASLIAASGQATASAAFLKIKHPNNNEKVRAGVPFTVIGTSAPSNATRTNCTVMLNTNHIGYQPVTPLGPHHTYTNWTAQTPILTPGFNQVEGQLKCFSPSGHGVTFLKHLVHNFTAIAQPTAPLDLSSNGTQ
jgi:hypothetical protein